MTTTMRRAGRLLALLGALAPLGCGAFSDDDVLEQVDDTLAEDTATATPAFGGPRDSLIPTDTSRPPAPDRSGDPEESLRALPPGEEGALPAWTTGRVAVGSTVQRGTVRLTDIRSARHEDYDRVVLDLGGDAAGMPGYRVEYVDEPLRECGSGHAIDPVGEGWLEVTLEPAAAHTEEGRPTVPTRPRDPGLPQVAHLYRTCDFEGTVTWVLAVESPEPFRAFSLRDPPRVVVDVRHVGGGGNAP